ncbi:MAG: hypothetical protein L6Q57_05685 [Alphaproteobacteria bacterium]|nr:hypothetical protein [Alphaproteobacteria bacterium]
MALFSSNRTVLLIADEALYIYTAAARAVRLVETVPWDAPNFEKNVAGIIVRDCGPNPLLIVNDMVEQHYRKERVVRTGVSFMDRSSIIRRKLNVAFPNYPVRAAFPLKEKITKGENRLAADIYIFAAVPETKQFNQTIQAAKLSLRSISAFCLLPVESSDLVKALSDKTGKKRDGKSKWAFFMGQHRNGGLRQIVTKDGELALTRMTPILESDEDPAAWAQDVHQEFKATMSYLARFGYQDEDGLNVTLIANPEAGAALESLIEEQCHFTSLTSVQAAKLLGISVGIQDDLRYADTLHVAWMNKKSKFILPMTAVSIDAVSRPRQAAMAASVLLTGGMLFLGYQLYDSMQSLGTVMSDIDSAESKISQLDVQYQLEVKKKEELGFDITLVQSSIAVKKQLNEQNIKLLPMFYGIGQALGKEGKVAGITVKQIEKSAVTATAATDDPNAPKPPTFEAILQMIYPSTTDVKLGNKEVQDLGQRLTKFLPGYEVEVTKLLKDFEYSVGVDVQSGQTKQQENNQDFVAEIRVRGS